jgi:hypothetical protein
MLARFQQSISRDRLPPRGDQTAYTTAQIPTALCEQGMDPALLADLRDLGFKFGSHEGARPGQRRLSLAGITLQVLDDVNARYLCVTALDGEDTEIIAVQRSDSFLLEAITWDRDLTPAHMKEWIDAVDNLFAGAFLVHPTTGERYNMQGRGLAETRVDVNWYFSEEGTYTIPELFDHDESCYLRHFAQPDQLSTFRAITGQLVVCRKIDERRARLRERAFLEAMCTVTPSPDEELSEEDFIRLVQKADEIYAKHNGSQLGVLLNLPESPIRIGGFFVPTQPRFDILAVIR